jgi:arsenite-transporting ATPase
MGPPRGKERTAPKGAGTIAGRLAAARERLFVGREAELELVRSAFEPVPVLTAPYLEREVVGPEMLDRLAGEVFGAGDPTAVLHSHIAQELVTENGRATLRVDVPFAEKGDLALKKIGLEVVVRVGAQKRTIMLPPALAPYAASGARFEDGTLEVSFERSGDAH